MNDRDFGLQVRSKIWLEMDGEPVFGQGREDLLLLVRKTGSINAAAKAMGISYRKAWSHIDAMEKRLGFPLVIRRKGGAGELRIVTRAGQQRYAQAMRNSGADEVIIPEHEGGLMVGRMIEKYSLV